MCGLIESMVYLRRHVRIMRPPGYLCCCISNYAYCTCAGHRNPKKTLGQQGPAETCCKIHLRPPPRPLLYSKPIGRGLAMKHSNNSGAVPTEEDSQFETESSPTNHCVRCRARRVGHGGREDGVCRVVDVQAGQRRHKLHKMGPCKGAPASPRWPKRPTLQLRNRRIRRFRFPRCRALNRPSHAAPCPTVSSVFSLRPASTDAA